MGSFCCCIKSPVPIDVHPINQKSTINPNIKEKGLQSKKDEENKSHYSPLVLRVQQKFTVPQLEYITNNYEKCIGEGGFGAVYYGKFGNNNTEVAVKVLSKTTAHAYKQFRAEAEILSKIHHRNLVRLMGYCNEENYMAIIYEYVHYGSLHDHLRGTTQVTSALNWNRRLKIAHGAAQGLNYVHSGCKLVHRDVKIANILLDKDLVAKVADFGLTREFDDFAKTMTICGTPGYFDPEIECTGRFNEKTDVYSFGVVLLELMTGKPPCFRTETGDNIHLSTYVTDKLVSSENIAPLVDFRIGEYDKESMERYVKLALQCTKRDQMKRPSMAFVVVQLQTCINLENAREKKREICREEKGDVCGETELSQSQEKRDVYSEPSTSQSDSVNLVSNSCSSNKRLVNE